MLIDLSEGVDENICLKHCLSYLLCPISNNILKFCSFSEERPMDKKNSFTDSSDMCVAYIDSDTNDGAENSSVISKHPDDSSIDET